MLDNAVAALQQPTDTSNPTAAPRATSNAAAIMSTMLRAVDYRDSTRENRKRRADQLAVHRDAYVCSVCVIHICRLTARVAIVAEAAAAVAHAAAETRLKAFVYAARQYGAVAALAKNLQQIRSSHVCVGKQAPSDQTYIFYSWGIIF